MVELNAVLAARTERSTSAEVDLTFELASFDAATSAFCALRALVAILSVVLAVTVLSDRSMSAAMALIWLAASADVAVSELCASRALLRIEAAVSAPTAVSVRSTSLASDLTWLAASERQRRDQRGLGLARAGERSTGGRGTGTPRAIVRHRRPGI